MLDLDPTLLGSHLCYPALRGPEAHFSLPWAPGGGAAWSSFLCQEHRTVEVVRAPPHSAALPQSLACIYARMAAGNIFSFYYTFERGEVTFSDCG